MALVTIISGSASDKPVVDPTVEILKKFEIPFELHVASAHRDPARVADIVRKAELGGTLVFIAVAGMAAHLAGMVAAHTTRPVIGLPVSSGPLAGQDSLLSTVMMPSGIPVATVAIDGGKNAAWLALEILALCLEGGRLTKALEDERVKIRKSLVEAEQKWVNEIQS
jgi:5-(carboxyamino)imidazole ribonucleotide mutase